MYFLIYLYIHIDVFFYTHNNVHVRMKESEQTTMTGQPTGCQLSNRKGAPGCSFRVLGRARFWSCAPHSKRLFLCILNIVSYGFGSTRGQGPRLSIRPTGRNVLVFVRDVTHVQTFEKRASFFKFLGHS